MTTTSALFRAGLVGFGTAATFFHLPLLQASGRFEVTHVVERTQSLSRSVLPNATIVRSVEALLAATPPVDVVVIATPTNLHYAQAKLALLAKKHVVVDKPFCVSHAEATELVALAASQGVLLTVFHNRRWDSDFLTVQDLLRQNLLGHVEYVEIHFDRCEFIHDCTMYAIQPTSITRRFRPEPKHNWKEDPAIGGGGLLYDLGSHLVDQMLVLFGPPASIQAKVETQRHYGVSSVGTDDYFHLTCQYDSGLVVVVTAGMLVAEIGPKFILRGTNGSFEKYGLDAQEASLRIGGSPATDPTFGVEDESLWGTWTKGPNAGERVPSQRGNYVAYYKGVADAIQHGTPPPVRAEDAARVIEILEQAKAHHVAPPASTAE
ncbi:hypothetical protein DYB30_004170 [Aphanomyces astaci]|uniref:Oxidoreductase n=1 Tax=Aphanomyces astaci TaxID=112090 RepID=A0A397E704_APHAT|nr:hypothetical protein DYB30_004170 [Aphanomyces astaci]RHY76818.1 hypothetical protein DYB38_002365 [Aphanomyces astaci]RHZ22639.1 hypothetical protein DYB26_001191 [Aphanomyces astaci]